VAGHPYLELIERRAVVFDGAMGTQIQALELTAADFGGDRQLGNNDHLSLTRPDAIEGIHLAYLEAGADVVETNSFQASRIRMSEWGVGDHTREINLCAARIARQVRHVCQNRRDWSDRWDRPTCLMICLNLH